MVAQRLLVVAVVVAQVVSQPVGHKQQRQLLLEPVVQAVQPQPVQQVVTHNTVQ